MRWRACGDDAPGISLGHEWRLNHLALRVHFDVGEARPVTVMVKIKPPGTAMFKRHRFEGRIMTSCVGMDWSMTDQLAGLLLRLCEAGEPWNPVRSGGEAIPGKGVRSVFSGVADLVEQAPTDEWDVCSRLRMRSRWSPIQHINCSA